VREIIPVKDRQLVVDGEGSCNMRHDGLGLISIIWLLGTPEALRADSLANIGDSKKHMRRSLVNALLLYNSLCFIPERQFSCACEYAVPLLERILPPIEPLLLLLVRLSFAACTE
jgi:hypothetical protein